MPRIRYIEKNFTGRSWAVIDQTNSIIEEYKAQGFVLTLRQLYYQFVSRDLMPNTMRSYKRIGKIVNDARLAGEIDWNAIEDRTRYVEKLASWDNAEEIVESCASQFRIDKWADQPYHVEVWIEKQALVGIIERVCNEFQVPFMACRGYLSQSEQWVAGQRFHRTGKPVRILHLGDHDPSGIDMTRDNQDRQYLFEAQDRDVEAWGHQIEVKRLALNMDQVDQYNPPPNPAKLTDTRAKDYIAEFGMSSWELDALEPSVIEELIRGNILALRDEGRWGHSLAREEAYKVQLGAAVDMIKEMPGVQ